MKLIKNKINSEELYEKLNGDVKELIFAAIKKTADEFKNNLGIDFEGVQYAKIIYPDSIPIILSNGFDGDFEYGYELILFENIMQNAQIKQKIEMEGGRKTHTCYLIEKVNISEPAFCFYRDFTGGDMQAYEEIIMVEIQ